MSMAAADERMLQEALFGRQTEPTSAEDSSWETLAAAAALSMANLSYSLAATQASAADELAVNDDQRAIGAALSTWIQIGSRGRASDQDIGDLRRAVADAPGTSLPSLWLARALALRGWTEEAMRVRASRSIGEELTPYADLTDAQILAASGDSRRAFAILKRLRNAGYASVGSLSQEVLLAWQLKDFGDMTEAHRERCALEGHRFRPWALRLWSKLPYVLLLMAVCWSFGLILGLPFLTIAGAGVAAGWVWLHHEVLRAPSAFRKAAVVAAVLATVALLQTLLSLS
jgi:hypothetical protein